MSLHVRSVVFVLILTAMALPSLAIETGGGDLPWNEPLTTLMDNITGPTATAVAVIGVAVFLLVWAVSSDNRALFGVAKAIAALSVIVLLIPFLNTLGITSACL